MLGLSPSGLGPGPGRAFQTRITDEMDFARMSLTNRPMWRFHFLGVAVLAALLVAFSVATSPSAARPAEGAAPMAGAAAKCNAQIQKGSKLVPVYERVYKYKFVKNKRSKGYSRKIVKVRQKVKVNCGKQCVVTKVKKKKRRPVYVTVKKKVVVKRNGRLVTVTKKVRAYKYAACKVKSGSVLGTPVTITMLPESKAILDFGAFQREAPVSGGLKGFVPGGINLSSDSQVTLTSGGLRLAPTAVFIDDDCDGQVSAAIRTGDPTAVNLDKTKTSISTVFANGTVTATANMVVRVPLELRNDDAGCNQPYITTGYSEFKQTFFLRGKLDPKLALTKLKLTSAPELIDVPVCLSAGLPTNPCNGFQIPLPIQISTQLYVAIKLS
jgi:hypothetical protein